MKTSGEIAIRESDFHGYKQNKVFALKEADLDSFTPREIALVDHLIRDFWGMTAQQISSVSHGFTGWRLAEQGETIPYEVALIARREPTPLERKRGIELEAMAMKARELSLDNAS